MVGSAIWRHLEQQGYKHLIGRSHKKLDLTNQTETRRFFEEEKPDYVFLAAGKVGGIGANSTYPAEFIYENLFLTAEVIHAAYLAGVKRLIYFGSSCIYPRLCPQPIREEYLLSGPLEPTNEAYAMAKITGIKMCQAYNQQYGTKYLSVMPTNLYGPADHYDLEKSHVLPTLIRKFHEAKIRGDREVTLWGTGSPRREFLHVDDLARAVVHLMKYPDADYDKLLKFSSGIPLINIGYGSDLMILELADRIREVVQCDAKIIWDASKPDGMPQKLMDSSRMQSLGWTPEIHLEEGLKRTYQDFLKEHP